MFRKTTTAAFGLVSFLIMASTMVVPSFGEAYEKRGIPGAEDALCRLDTRLSLTPDQKEKLLPLLRQEREKRQEMVDKHRQEMRELRQSFHEKMTGEWKNTESRFSSVLTAQQMKEFEKIHTERQQRWQERSSRGKSQGRKGNHGYRGCR